MLQGLKILLASKLDVDLNTDSAIICCNGPSLNDVDFDKIVFPVIGLNKIYIHSKAYDKIKMIFVVNKLVIRQVIMDLLTRRFKVGTRLVVIPSHRLIARLILPNSRCIATSNDHEFRSTGTYSIGSTVTNVALQFLYRNGIKKVYVVGMDHSFSQVGEPNEEQLLNEDDINHFSPEYFKNNKWHLADLNGSELVYAQARLLFEKAGGKIVNVGFSNYTGWERMSLEEFYEVQKEM